MGRHHRALRLLAAPPGVRLRVAAAVSDPVAPAHVLHVPGWRWRHRRLEPLLPRRLGPEPVHLWLGLRRLLLGALLGPGPLRGFLLLPLSAFLRLVRGHHLLRLRRLLS